jgi:mannosyltransferase
LNDPRLVVPFLLLLALALRLPNLTESMWYDEVQYSTRLVSSSAARLWRFVTSGLPSPLYPAGMFLWTGVFGESELAVRVPSLAAGLASIALTWVVARRIGGPATAALAGLFLCFSPAHIWYSQEATPYMTMVCFLLAAMAAWPHLVKEGRSNAEAGGSARWYLLYAGSFVAAALTHYVVAVFLLPLTILALWAEPRARRRLLVANAAIALVIALVVGFKYLRGGVPTGGLGYLRPFTLFEWWMLFFNWCLHGNSLWQVNPYSAETEYLLQAPGLLALQIACAVVVLRGLWAGRPDEAGPRWELAACLFTLPVVMWILTVAGRDEMYIERYLLAVLPFFAIALASGATAWSHPPLRAASAAFVVLLAAGSFAAYTARSDEWTVYKQNPDWRSAVRYLRSQPGDPARARVVAATGLSDIIFYVRRDLPGSRRASRFNRGQLRAWAEGGTVDTVYFLDNLYWRSRAERALVDLKRSPHVRWVSLQRFKGVELHTFDVVAPGPS